MAAGVGRNSFPEVEYMKHSFVKSVYTKEFPSVRAEQRQLKYVRLTNLSDNC